jgi:peptidoglycan/xylan/chitin deacetylase (PgdA/CDA1 family)
LPSGFISLLNDFRITRKNFYSPYGKKETNERVASVSKGMISHIIRNALEYLYHSRGLPFVSLWHFPSGSENVFSFRIDTDFGSRESINELYNIVKNRNIKATWFIETVSAEKSLDDFKKFNNQEIALHCYRHKVFSTYRKNSEQIRKALSILKHNDISTNGFAAPYGQWNRNLGRVITDLEFCYSSEFGFVYDSLPLFPGIKKDTFTSLQIPVHPVSLGRLHWGGHNSVQMLQYFQNIFAQKASLYDPVIIYAHPADLKFNIWDKILDSGLSYNFTNLTLREYAAWWKKRGSLTWEASYDGNNTNIITGNKDKSFWVSILTPQNEMILKPLSGKPSVEKKLHEPVFKLNNLFSAASLREKTKRMFYHDLLSHYRKLKQ